MAKARGGFYYHGRMHTNYNRLVAKWNECRAREWCPVTKAEAEAYRAKSGGCYRPATEPVKPEVKLYRCLTTADLGYDPDKFRDNL